MLKIITVPNPILASTTKPVVNFDKKLKKIISEMIETLEAQNDPPGVGLAANQVGFNISLFIIKPTKKSLPQVFINPQILKLEYLKKSDKKSKNKKELVKFEGCLSIPKIWGPIKRADKVLLKYQDENGDFFEKWFSGFEAIIIQHEVDHLQGIVFTQRSFEQGQKLYKEKKNHLEEIQI
ncbi:MAG: peptide deformylase [Candidatus Microgenomates bacterium]